MVQGKRERLAIWENSVDGQPLGGWFCVSALFGWDVLEVAVGGVRCLGVVCQKQLLRSVLFWGLVGVRGGSG